MLDPEITPSKAMRETGRWTPALIMICLAAVLVVTAGILVPGYYIGGWFGKHNIARTYNNTVTSQSYQDALLAQMQQHLTNITGPGGLQAQRQSVPASSPEQANLRASELNEIGSLCSESTRFAPQMEGPAGAQLQTTIAANCAAGTPVAAPPLADPVPTS